MAIQRIGQSREAEVPDIPIGESLGYENESEAEYMAAIRRLAQSIEEKSRYVDEYGPVGNGVAYSVTQVQLNPQFEDYYERIKRVIVVGPLSTGISGAAKFGTVTNPGAGTAIVNLGLLPAGTYQAFWTVSLEGTVTTADADNMRLQYQSGTVLERAVYEGLVGDYPQSSVQIVSDGTVATQLVIQSIAAASGVSAIYTAQVSAIPVSGQLVPFTLQLGDRNWNLQLPNTGILEFSADILLSRNDIRKLTSTVAGQWFLELTGEADVRNKPSRH